MFIITDTYGTRRVAWTWRAALEWLEACGPDAAIQHRLTGRTVAARQQRRIY